MNTKKTEKAQNSPAECPESKSQKLNQSGISVERLFCGGNPIGRRIYKDDVLVKEVIYPGYTSKQVTSTSPRESVEFVCKDNVGKKLPEEESDDVKHNISFFDLTDQDISDFVKNDNLIIGDNEAVVLHVPYNYNGLISRAEKQAKFHKEFQNQALENAIVYNAKKVGELKCKNNKKKYFTQCLENMRVWMKKVFRL